VDAEQTLVGQQRPETFKESFVQRKTEPLGLLVDGHDPALSERQGVVVEDEVSEGQVVATGQLKAVRLGRVEPQRGALAVEREVLHPLPIEVSRPPGAGFFAECQPVMTPREVELLLPCFDGRVDLLHQARAGFALSPLDFVRPRRDLRRICGGLRIVGNERDELPAVLDDQHAEPGVGPGRFPGRILQRRKIVAFGELLVDLRVTPEARSPAVGREGGIDQRCRDRPLRAAGVDELQQPRTGGPRRRLAGRLVQGKVPLDRLAVDLEGMHVHGRTVGRFSGPRAVRGGNGNRQANHAGDDVRVHVTFLASPRPVALGTP